jgi:hypothetical protein|tara:strand:- start:346 stop:732 length:387 start_codon:yes stop_codon:yes gene_type:complete
MSISNKDCAPYVTKRKEFKGSHLFGEWDGPTEWIPDNTLDTPYIVYSHGYHFPIYIWVGGVWYENTDKYSASTSKHQTQARPDALTVRTNTNGMMDILRGNFQNRIDNDYDDWFEVYGKKTAETEPIY